MTSSPFVTGYIFCTTHLPNFLRWQNDPHRWRLQRRKGSNVMRISPQGGMSWFLPEWRLASTVWHRYHLCAIRSNYRDPLYILPYVSVVLKRKMSSIWRNFHLWQHRKLSKGQLPVQPKIKISSKWQHFCFSVCFCITVSSVFRFY